MKENRYANLDYPEDCVPYQGDLLRHPFVAVIEAIGITDRHDGTNCISWKACENQSIVYWITLNITEKKHVYISIIAAFGVVSEVVKDTVSIEFLERNENLSNLFRYCLMNNVLKVRFDSHSHWITEECLRHKLDQILEFARFSYENHVLNGEIGLQALPLDWFRKAA